MKKVTIHIEGMMCQHCTNRVQGILAAIEGVSAVQVDLEKATAMVEAADTLSEKVLTEAVEDAGYDVTGCEVL